MIATLLLAFSAFTLPASQPLASAPSGLGPNAGAGEEAASSSAAGGTAGQDAESVLKAYDLAHLQWAQEEEGDRMRVSLSPGLTFPRAELENESEDRGRASGDRVLVLIQALLGEEFQYEGRRFMETGRGQLLVSGPPALHQRVGLILETLERISRAHVALGVEVWTLPAGAKPAGIGSVVPLAEADRWAEGLAGLGGKYAHYDLQVQPGRAALLKLTRDVQAILDYDVEIAQGAAIPDPIWGTAAIGTRLALRAAPSPTGVHLAFTWRNTDLLDAPEREVQAGAILSTGDSKPSFYDDPMLLSGMRALTRAASLSTHLPSGHALILEVSANLRRGGTHEFVVLRQTGATMPRLESLDLGGGGQGLLFAHLGSIVPPSCAHNGALLDATRVPELLQRYFSDLPVLSAGLREPEASPLVGLLSELGGRAVSVDIQGDWITAWPSSPSKGSASGFAAIRSGLEQLTASSETLEVRVELHQAGVPVVVSQVPVRLGTSCGLSIAIDDFEQPDYDVEVAQFAAIDDPKIMRGIDGLVLLMEPSVGPEGRVSIQLRGSGHLLLEREKLELGGSLAAPVEQSSYAHLVVNETVALARGDGGRQAAVLGFQGDGARASDLTLKVEVRR